jgi:stringent starvation protein B
VSTKLHPRVLAEYFRAETDYFNVWVVPRVSGVVLPEALYEADQVVLAIGDRLSRPIPNLQFDDWGFTGTLLFGGEPCKVMVPWHSVAGLATANNEVVVVWQPLAEPLCAPPELFEGRRAIQRNEKNHAVYCFCPRRQREVDDCVRWMCRGSECGYGTARKPKANHLKVVK